jgi:O-methyltransferase/methyltransferase family protein
MASVAPPAVTPDLIFQLAQGFMASKMLFAAGDIGLFEALGGGPATADEIAARTKIPVRSLRVVANAMVALGLLSLENGGYRNTDVAQTFLAGRTPADLRPLLTFWNRLSFPAWDRFTETVRADGKREEIFDFSPEDQALFSAGVEAATAGGARALAESYDFARHRRMLDIGGGTGSFLKAVRRRHPGLSATLFEFPGTAAFARSKFTPEDAAAIQIVEGSMLKDALPGGHDVHLLAHVLHCCSVEQNLTVLTRAAQAAPAGGRLLIVEFFLDSGGTSPVAATLISGEFLMNTFGVSYTLDEVKSWLPAAGWRPIEHLPLAGPVSVLIAER